MEHKQELITMKTHKVIDEICHEDENNVVHVGTIEECNDFISEQGGMLYKIIPLTSEELELENR